MLLGTDPQGEVIIREINDYAQKNPHRVAVVPSLGRTRYISMLHYVAAVLCAVFLNFL